MTPIRCIFNHNYCKYTIDDEKVILCSFCGKKLGKSKPQKDSKEPHPHIYN